MRIFTFTVESFHRFPLVKRRAISDFNLRVGIWGLCKGIRGHVTRPIVPLFETKLKFIPLAGEVEGLIL